MTKQEFIQTNSGSPKKSIENTINLLEKGATIPFISRYRKEMTGGLDEVEIGLIRDLLKKFNTIKDRQNFILKTIKEQGKLTSEIESKLLNCFDSEVLEDIYRPFKLKKSSKADKARKLGLEPLAKMIMSQKSGDIDTLSQSFYTKQLTEFEDILSGAIDIISEWMIDNEIVRERLREKFERYSVLEVKVSKGKEKEAEKYRDYFNHSEKLSRIPAHRFLAITRASNEKLLSIKARPADEDCISFMERFFIKRDGDSSCGEVVKKACKDAYRKSLRGSLENEVLSKRKKLADQEAISVFAKNLKKLLLESPLGAYRILAIDPGFRTGCKVVCLDEQGSLLTNTTIFPHPPQKELSKAKAKVSQLVESYKIDAIAIGDGTAGRETENFIKHIKFNKDVNVFVVREDGASIYSASSIAREEFPNFDVTVRGAVSIGRRLMDPLSELVKIEPKSLGIGQYQHEVEPVLLKESLDDVVVSAVNQVGVEVNLASPYLLSYVSGLSLSLAKNIVAFREENGKINSRKELLKVPRLGDKAYEQAAGFIRIENGSNPLDNSAVHPESYELVNDILKKTNLSIDEITGNIEELNKLRSVDFNTNSYTFEQVIGELKKPSRDPRTKAKILEFDHRVKKIEDLVVGMSLTGIVTNVTNFGAFVNIGIKENGLIHKSNLADTYVEDPSQFIGLHDHVTVQVLEVDVTRKRVGLKRLS